MVVGPEKEILNAIFPADNAEQPAHGLLPELEWFVICSV
jgi:hypothetical protein